MRFVDIREKYFQFQLFTNDIFDKDELLKARELSIEDSTAWVSLFYVPPASTESFDEFNRMLDRIRQAIIYGASAVIVLATNVEIFRKVKNKFFIRIFYGYF